MQRPTARSMCLTQESELWVELMATDTGQVVSAHHVVQILEGAGSTAADGHEHLEVAGPLAVVHDVYGCGVGHGEAS